MSIVAVHGPNTMGSKAVTEVGPAMATVDQSNGLIWTFKLDQSSTRTTSLAWTFPTGTPATATGPGPHTVTYASAGSKANTAVATGAGEGANPYPPAGTTNIPVTAVSGAAPQMMMMGAPEEGEGEEFIEEDDSDEESPEVPIAFDPAAHTVAEVEEYADEHPEQAAELLDAEVAGKNRSTLVAFLEGLIPFDPGAYSVADVIAYADENPDEAEEILEAERAGKNRTTLISHLEGLVNAE